MHRRILGWNTTSSGISGVSVVTHYRFDPDVLEVVRAAEDRFSVHGATYVDHPWPGWDGRSVDFWSNDSFDPIPLAKGYDLKNFLMALTWGPYIRHWIYLHRLWTAWGGVSSWRPGDHAGRSRHLHVTYYR
jgi:hypothetical protein